MIITRSKNKSSVVFYDGNCRLCNGFKDFIIRYDRKKKFQFVPLQSVMGRELKNIHAFTHAKLNSLVLSENGSICTESDAVLRILEQLDRFGLFYRITSLIPRYLRNMIYKSISENRYRILGRYENIQ